MIALAFVLACGPTPTTETVPADPTSVPDEDTGGGTGTDLPTETPPTTTPPTGTDTATPPTTPPTDTGTTPPAAFSVALTDLDDVSAHPIGAECPDGLPAIYSCDGSNPEVVWEGIPVGTVTLALIFDDPDAGDYPHWAIYNIPPTVDGLAAAISGESIPLPHPLPSDPVAGIEARELKNGAGGIGYFGSCPSDPHVYRWRLFALDAVLPAITSGNGFDQFEELEDLATDAPLGMALACSAYGPGF